MDECSIPLSIVVIGASRHDISQLGAVLDAIVIDRPQKLEQYFCADKGYHGSPVQEAIETKYYVSSMRQRGKEVKMKRTIPRYKLHLWIGEVAHSWFNRFRKLLICYEKFNKTYEALLLLAATIIC